MSLTTLSPLARVISVYRKDEIFLRRSSAIFQWAHTRLQCFYYILVHPITLISINQGALPAFAPWPRQQALTPVLSAMREQKKGVVEARERSPQSSHQSMIRHWSTWLTSRRVVVGTMCISLPPPLRYVNSLLCYVCIQFFS
jgi:hypothetical protein